MKISKARLKSIILEELQNVMSEFNMADLDIVNKMKLPNGEIIEIADDMGIEDELNDLKIQYKIEDDTAVISMIPPESKEAFERLY